MSAVFSEANYVMNRKNISKKDRMAEIQETLPDGYKIHEKSNRDVALFVNPETEHAVISHRGTNFKYGKDIAADLLYSLGMENHSKEFKKRTARTEELTRSVPQHYSITLQGHSYGGATALNSAIKNPKVRHRVDEIKLFNPLTFGSHEDQKVHTKKDETEQEAIDMLNDITTTHRTANDIVSLKDTVYGKTKTYKQKAPKYKSVPVGVRSIFKAVDQLNAHSLHNFK